MGIYADSYSFVTLNTVYRQNASGDTGIEINGATVDNNTIFANTYGIIVIGSEDMHVDSNLIYSNTYGLVINNVNGSNASLYGYNYVTTATNNVIYDNTGLGISLSGNLDLSLIKQHGLPAHRRRDSVEWI